MKMATTAQVFTHHDPSYASDSLLRLSKLRQEGILCDLTILVQGKKFKAHQTVMAGCSDYFLTAICGGKSTASVSVTNGATGSHMTIELQYVTMRGFAPLLEYAYSSDLRVNASDVIDVLSAASYMQMFNVANACSEFMRTNLLWTQGQSRLNGLPLLPGGRGLLLNGHGDHTATLTNTSRPANGLPDAVTSLLRATSAMSNSQSPRTNPLAPPPMLLPISSVHPYEAGLQQWVDTMAGTQKLLSRFVSSQNTQSHSPSSSSPRHSPPMINQAVIDQQKHIASIGSPRSKEKEPENNQHSPGLNLNIKDENNNNNTNSNNNNNSKNPYRSGGRKSIAVKLEPSSDDVTALRNDNEEGRQSRPSNPVSPEDAEDSWQSLQKLYSLSSKPENKNSVEEVKKGLHRGAMSPVPPAFLQMARSPAGIKSVLEKMGDVNALQRLESGISMVPRMNSLSVHTALLQQRQMLAQQQQQQQQQIRSNPASDDAEKLVPELPAVPPSGQYMSVRRRTLQSNVPKPHQCQICGSRFTRFHNLKQHIKLHSGIKPYECDECGKRFTRNYTLRLHKMKHVGLRNFRCGTCDASFTSLGEYRAHLRITMHSHMPANVSGSPQMLGRMMEGSQRIGRGLDGPEDLSNSQMPPALKFGQFDSTMLAYGIGSPASSGGGAAGEGSTGTISPPGVQNASVGGNDMGPEDSPHRSDRSLSGSPQDLSTKRPYSDTENTDKSYRYPTKYNTENRRRSAPVSPITGVQSYAENPKRQRAIITSPAHSDDDGAGVVSDDEPMSLVVDTGAEDGHSSN